MRDIWRTDRAASAAKAANQAHHPLSIDSKQEARLLIADFINGIGQKRRFELSLCASALP